MVRFVLAAILLVANGSVYAAPRPVSDAEKAACEAVADHLARGPVAILERLATSSPLLANGKTAALAEIEARIGPRDDARWELRTASEDFATHGAVFRVIFPSGVDDIITFDLKAERGAWRIQTIRTLAEAPPSREKRALLPVATAILVIVVTRKKRSKPLIAIAAGAVLALAAAAFVLTRPKSTQTSAAINVPAAADVGDSFVQLLPLRRALAAGQPLPVIGQFTGDLRDVALMWKAQREIGHASPDKLEQDLYGVSGTDAPLVALLRARVAAADGRDNDATKQYAILRNVEPKSDALWFEEETSSPQDAAIEIVRHAIELKSRDADAYYMFCIHQLINDRQPQALASLQNAMIMKPASRATIVSSGILTILEKAASVIDVSAPDEPRRIDQALSTDPMRVPAETRASASGMFLRLAIGGGRLDIACGTPLAPKGTAIVTGAEMERIEADDALRRVEKANDPKMIEDAIDVLEGQNRWGDILRLTESTWNATPELLLARIRALVRTKSKAEAKALGASTSAKEIVEQMKNPTAVARLAELLAEAGAYDDALAAYRKLQEKKDTPRIARRITQIGLRRTLDMSTETAHTAHFEIHSMPDVPTDIPARIGQTLESELQRLMARFKLTHFRTVRVNVLKWNDFRWSVTGSRYVVGFYDGDLTIPWGTLGFGLSSNSVTTHELTHAVIAQMTNDNAPRWFHEGLAQRMEPPSDEPKPEKTQLCALALLEPMLESSADIADIESAYAQSEAVIRFLEAKYGEQSINKLMAAYRAGTSDADALQALSGKSIPDLDRDFRKWAAR